MTPAAGVSARRGQRVKRIVVIVIAVVCLLLCEAALVAWLRQAEQTLASVQTRDGWRYLIRVSGGRLAFCTPPRHGTSEGEARARQALAGMDNARIHWSMSTADFGNPRRRVFPGGTQALAGLEVPADKDPIWPLFETLNDPARHLVAHAALTRRASTESGVAAEAYSDGTVVMQDKLRFKYGPEDPSSGRRPPVLTDLPTLRRYWAERLAVPMVSASLPVVAGVTGIVPVAALVAAVMHFRARRRRRQAGQCVECGYDVRASPRVCPECGTRVVKPRPAKRAVDVGHA